MHAQQDKAKSIFLNAVEIASASERHAYLAAQCGGDEALRREVEELLQHHPQVGSFLDAAAAGSLATVGFSPVTEQPGTMIGPYKLLEQIGEGGFGVVFLAEQTEPVRRKVALKILKPGMDTKQVISRFEAERQALALMEHSNIAHVYDAGTTESGRPYFVMELVKGVPITEFCDAKKLDTRERLQLFLQVCQAVQHAHQKGIIHRDIKPSNVLVTPHDGVPVVKVIDFGIAKAMSGQLTDKTIFTGFAQMIGTPLYMSPEQAEINALDVDTRSDIYSLGVLMYELLTGTTPFDKERLSKATFDELRKIIREEEPPRPSARISTMGKLATTISEQRQSDPRKLSHLLRGELDWIVMRTLEKDRQRRYESASALAKDVQRYLDNEPVEARPASSWYRFCKYVRRNRVVLSATVLVIIALAVGTVVSSWQAILANKARQETEVAEELALERLKESQEAGHEAAQQRDITYVALDRIYLRLVETELPRHPDRLQLSGYRQILRAALACYSALAKRAKKSPRSQQNLTIAYLRAGQIHELLEEYQEAEKSCTKALETISEHPSSDLAHARLRAQAIGSLGKLYQSLGRFEEAESNIKKALHILEGIPVASRSPLDDRFHAGLLGDRGHIHFMKDEMVDAVRFRRKSYEEFKRLSEPSFAVRCARANAAQKLAAILIDSEPSEAKRLLDAAHAEFTKLRGEQPRSTKIICGLCDTAASRVEMLVKTHNEKQAMAETARAIDLAKQLVKAFPGGMKYHRLLMKVHINAAFAHVGEKTFDPDSFAKAVTQAKELAERFPASHAHRADYVRMSNNYGYLLERSGQWRKAENIYREALSASHRLADDFAQVPEYRRLQLLLHYNLARVLFKQGKAQAVDEVKTALNLSTRLPDPMDRAHFQRNFGVLLRKFGRKVETQALHKKIVDALDTFKAAESQRERLLFEQAKAHLGLGVAHDELAHYDDALKAFEASKAFFTQLLDKYGKKSSYESQFNDLKYNFGAVYRHAKNPKAEDAFRTAVDERIRLVKEYPADPEHSQKLLYYVEGFASFLNSKGKLPEATVYLTEAIDAGGQLAKDYPSRKEYWHRLPMLLNMAAMIKYMEKDFDSAESLTKRAVEMDEHLLEKFGANRSYEKRRAWNLGNLSVVTEFTHNDRLRRKTDERRVALHPNNPVGLNSLAWHLATCKELKMRDGKRAVELAEKAVKLSPKNSEYRSTLGAAYYYEKRYQDALVSLSKALELRKVKASVGSFDEFYLAMTYYQLRNKTAARAAFDRAVKTMKMLGGENKLRYQPHLNRLRDEAEMLLQITNDKEPN